MVASYVDTHHSFLWTIDQCWNILKPDYKAWEIGGLLAAANNQNIDYTGKKYTWGTSDSPSGTYKTVEANTDADRKNNLLVGKLNDQNDGVAKKVGKVWGDLKSDWRKLWKDLPFDVPVRILSVVGGVLGLLFIMGLIITIFVNKNGAFIVIGISFSVLAAISIISPLLSANGKDKDSLRNATVAYKYTGITGYNIKTGTTWNATATNASSGEVPNDTLGTDKEIHLRTSGTTAPTVAVKNDTAPVLKEEELAEINIHCIIGY